MGHTGALLTAALILTASPSALSDPSPASIAQMVAPQQRRDAGSCTPGTFRCLGADTVQQCNGDGAYVFFSTCSAPDVCAMSTHNSLPYCITLDMVAEGLVLASDVAAPQQSDSGGKNNNAPVENMTTATVSYTSRGNHTFADCRSNEYLCETQCGVSFIQCFGAGKGVLAPPLSSYCTAVNVVCNNGAIDYASRCSATSESPLPPQPSSKASAPPEQQQPSPPAPAVQTGSSAYQQQGLTACQYDIILRITSVFETSSTNLNFGICEDAGDGQGYSAGFIQFTTSSGSALRVIKIYLATTTVSDPPIARFVDALTAAAQKGNGGATYGQGYTDGFDGYCEAWATAARTDSAAFAAAQLSVQSDSYLAPNLDLVTRKLGLKTAVGVGQMYDCAVQLGPNSLGLILALMNTSVAYPSAGGDEVAFLNAFLDAKTTYINNLGGAYAATGYRIRSYRHIIAGGNLNFANGEVEMLENGGNPIPVRCQKY